MAFRPASLCVWLIKVTVRIGLCLVRVQVRVRVLCYRTLSQSGTEGGGVSQSCTPRWTLTFFIFSSLCCRRCWNPSHSSEYWWLVANQIVIAISVRIIANKNFPPKWDNLSLRSAQNSLIDEENPPPKKLSLAVISAADLAVTLHGWICLPSMAGSRQIKNTSLSGGRRKKWVTPCKKGRHWLAEIAEMTHSKGRRRRVSSRRFLLFIIQTKDQVRPNAQEKSASSKKSPLPSLKCNFMGS